MNQLSLFPDYQPTHVEEPAKQVVYNPALGQAQLLIGAPITQIRLIQHLEHRLKPEIQVCSPADVAAWVYPIIKNFATEIFLSVHLNNANKIINACICSQGGLSAAIVEPRTVFQAAILSNAASIIAVHNHPSSNLEPSRQDIKITKQLIEAGKVCGIPLHDHLIVIDKVGRYTSLAERGLMN